MWDMDSFHYVKIVYVTFPTCDYNFHFREEVERLEKRDECPRQVRNDLEGLWRCYVTFSCYFEQR